MTVQGRRTNFDPKTVNASGSTLPKDVRFREKSLVDKGTGQTCFLGPGSYNDQQAFYELTKQSCQSKMMPMTALPHKESGQQCYIMVGD